MAYTKLVMKNPETGREEVCPVGVSWTFLFFGFLVPLFRGDLKWAVGCLVLGIFTFGMSGFIFMFMYNTLYVKGLICKGYKVKLIDNATIDQVSMSLGLELPLLKNA
ncbi:hypothetical protein [Thaumasiovibrio sp. DFM-14]|uniref:hypothetical protein n=1 Tax=Thaumasiovibrio sp. DFM-14 TaxID=3384792 RepID=UPI0039A17F55